MRYCIIEALLPSAAGLALVTILVFLLLFLFLHCFAIGTETMSRVGALAFFPMHQMLMAVLVLGWLLRHAVVDWGYGLLRR